MQICRFDHIKRDWSPNVETGVCRINFGEVRTSKKSGVWGGEGVPLKLISFDPLVNYIMVIMVNFFDDVNLFLFFLDFCQICFFLGGGGAMHPLCIRLTEFNLQVRTIIPCTRRYTTGWPQNINTTHQSYWELILASNIPKYNSKFYFTTYLD